MLPNREEWSVKILDEVDDDGYSDNYELDWVDLPLGGVLLPSARRMVTSS